LYGFCLQSGSGISIDLRGAAHYFKLSADQGNAHGPYHYAMCLLTGSGLPRDGENAIQYFELSAESGSPDGQTVVGWMAENGVGHDIDFVAAARYYELSADHSPAGAARFGRCCHLGQGVAADSTIAAEFFRKAADSNDADGANSFGCCLERGDGVSMNIDQAVDYYRKAASQSHPAGLYNFGRCLEYGRGIEGDFVRSAKYYRKSAKLGDPSAQNSFGIFLERGIGIRSNHALAAHYFELSAAQGDPDGANNFGFCLEHGRGVRQNIEAASKWYRFAANHGHPEGEVNYQRSLRLLGRWNVPDRSDKISDRPRSDSLAQKFIEGLKDLTAGAELIASIQRLKATMGQETNCATEEWTGAEVGRGNSGIVILGKSGGGELIAVKTAERSETEESIRREIRILKRMNHPLVVRIGDRPSGGSDQRLAVVTEFAPNGSLADHLPDAKNGDLCQLSSSTQIVRIIVGIVLAMRYIHSQNVIHCDLIPRNILLDWDWKVRICDFGHSILPDPPNPTPPILERPNQYWPSVVSHYLAPECYNGVTFMESDVFSFGMILYELIIGRAIFSRRETPFYVALALFNKDWKPDIPESVIPEAAELIRDCLAFKYEDRPSFTDILKRLKEIRFKLMTAVNSAKITAFVDSIEKWEADNPE
jgi:TPR repeat protein